MDKSKKSALEVLSTLHKRPSSEEATSLNDQDIFSAAMSLGFPIYQKSIGEILEVHKVVLPLIENIIKGILVNEENLSPDYYPIARDGELLYDALLGLGQVSGSTLSKRTHYTKASSSMEKTGNFFYFESLGINEKRAKEGLPLIFLDSGFMGSIFDDIADSTGIYVPSAPNYRGYLVSRSSLSRYLPAIPFTPFSSEDDLELKKKNV